MNELETRQMTPRDWPAVRAIYQEGIETGDATFETEAPEWEGWDQKFLADPRVVALEGGEVLGWGALAAVSDRCVYGGVGEVAVYVRTRARGKGVGTALLGALVEASEAAGYWTLQAGIFPENEGSVRIHEKCGFRVVGIRERLGKLAGCWRDVLLLERRSSSVGL